MKKILLASSALLVLSFGPALAMDAATGTAAFKDTKGNDVGTATLTEDPDGVKIHLELKSLAPGEHGFHIHEKGDCSPEGTFTNAGDHLNPAGHEHGTKSEHGPHAGDLRNIIINADGTLTTDIVSETITFSASKTDRALLNDADGAAFIIHANPDDYMTQPAGAAGDRSACAVIEKN